MTCLFDKNLLQEYLDGTIEPLEKIILEEHLKVCGDCRRDLSDFKLLLWELEEMPPIDLPPEALDIKDEVLNRIVGLEVAPDHNKGIGFKNVMEIQNNIIKNTTLFFKFIPGGEMLVNSSKITAKKASSQMTGYLKSSFKRRTRNLLLRTSI